MDISIIRLVNPAAFEMVDIQQLVADAFADSYANDTDHIIDQLVRYVMNPNICILAGQEDLKWRALCIITPANFLPEPQVFHFYVDGSSNLRKALVDSMVEWIKGEGYNGFWTSNINGENKDAAFKRLFKRIGKAEKMGTIFRFEVNQ